MLVSIQENVWFVLLVVVGLSGFLSDSLKWLIGRFFIGVSQPAFLGAKKPTADEIELFKKDDSAFDTYLEEHNLDKEAQKDLRQTRDIWHYHQNLENPRYLRRYESSLERMLRLIAKVVGDKPKFRPSKVGNGSIFKRSKCFSVKSYEFCLKLALAYPAIFAFLNWLGGGELSVGGFVLMEAVGPLMRLSLMVALTGGVLVVLLVSRNGLLVLFYFMFIMIGWLGALELSNRTEVLLPVIVALIIVFFLEITLVTGAASVFWFVSAALFLDPATVQTFADRGAFEALADSDNAFFFGVLFFAIPLAAGRFYSKKSVKKNLYWVVFNIFFLTCLSGALQYSLLTGKDKQVSPFLLLPVFLGLLPLLNAFMDWCSLNLTRKLLLSISSHHSRLGITIAITIFDLLAAVFFVFAITALVVCVLAGINAFAYFFAEGKTVLDFSILMADIKHPDRWQQSLWLHFMVLSTLVPTLLHFIFALFAIALWPLNHWHKKHLSKFWQSDDARAAVYTRMRLAGGVSFLILGGFIYLGYLLLSQWWLGPAQWLWNWADMWLRLIDPSYLGPA